MGNGLKNKIIELRKQGWTYPEIKEELKCTLGVISYHCKNENLFTAIIKNKKISKEKQKELQEYYNEGNPVSKVAEKFKICNATVLKYIETRSLQKFTKEEMSKRNGKKQNERRRKLKEILVKYKGGKCEKCGYDKCIRALEFHHINSNEKEISISSGTYSLEKLKKEVDKCILVCSNCHREIEDEIYKEK